MEETAPAANLSIDASPSPQEAAQRAANAMATAINDAIAIKGFAAVAVSGGSTPGLMFDSLATMTIDWGRVHLFQVDERMVAANSIDRNFAELQRRLLRHVGIPEDHVHPLPVPLFLDPAGLAIASSSASAALRRVCGSTLDVVHLGLGDDGHTASLVPNDRALTVMDSEVTWTLPYKGHRRLTLTFPVLQRARCVIWLACGTAKQKPLALLRSNDPSIAAGHVRSGNQTAFVDHAAFPNGEF